MCRISKLFAKPILPVILVFLMILLVTSNEIGFAQTLVPRTVCEAAGNSYVFDSNVTPHWIDVAVLKLGDGSRWREILTATQNRSQLEPNVFRNIQDPNTLRNGECLALPVADERTIEFGLTGDIVVFGSSTVLPLFRDFIENEFETVARLNGSMIDVIVQEGDSTAGIHSICDPSSAVDVARVSRRMTQQEHDTCGTNIMGFVVARDAIVLIVNASNSLISRQASVQEAVDLLIGNTGTNLVRYYPNRDSGTSYEVAAIFGVRDGTPINVFLDGMFNQTNKVLEFQSDETIVDDVRADVDGFSFVPYSPYKIARDNGFQIELFQVQCLPDLVVGYLGGTNPCPFTYVNPDEPSVESRQYPLSRPVFIYVRTHQVRDDDALYNFMRYALHPTTLQDAQRATGLFGYPAPISPLTCLEAVRSGTSIPANCAIDNLALYP